MEGINKCMLNNRFINILKRGFIMNRLIEDMIKKLYRGLAVAYQTVGMKKKALDCVNTIIEKGQDEAYDWWIQGSILAELKHWQGASYALSKAYEYGYDRQKCIYWLGKSVEYNGEHNLALKYYDAILKKDQQDWKALLAKGQLLFKRDAYHEALICLRKGIEIKPNDPDILNNIGLCYLKVNDLPLAKEYIEKALIYKEKDLLIRYNLAVVLTRMEEYESAIKTLHKYVDESSFDYLKLMGYCYAQINIWEKAIAYFEKALTFEPENNEILMNLSAVYARMKEKERALEIIKKLILNNGNNCDLLNNLAWIYEELEMYEEAEGNYYRGLALSKGDPRIVYNLICCLKKQSKYAESMILLDYLKANMQWNKTAWKLEAEIYECMGAEKKAVICYNKALGLE